MGYVVKMPKLGLEMEQGTMLEWHVEEGESVAEDDVIAEIESEKSIGEIEAREDGVLRLAALEEGESVPPGTPIGIVAGADEDVSDLRAEFEAEEGSDEPEPESDEATEPDAASGDGEAPVENTGASAEAEPGESVDVKASPRAERRAEELGVGLADVDGSGPQGAITEDDVEAAASGGGGGRRGETTAEQVKASPRAKRRADELDVDLTAVEGSGPQGAITEGDVEAAHDAPSEAIEAAAAGGGRAEVRPGRYRSATLVVDGEGADALIEATELAGRAFDVETSPLDVLLVAVSAALVDRPAFNATIEDGTHHLHTRQDVAVATESGGELLRPVVEGVEGLSFAELVETRHETVDGAIASGTGDGRATFALGLEEEIDDDVESLIEAPTAAGLLANSSRRRAVPAENGVSLERCLSLSLAYDTRVLGDRDAEAFLESLLEHVGNAPELVLRTYGERGP